MIEPIDFQPYLESIRAAYKQWWQLYTLTDAAGRQRQEKQVAPTFDFGLMVQRVKQEERREEEKIERFPVLEGIRKYAVQHVLLVGRPGSGKSTALARLMLEEATTPQGRIPILVELRYWQGSIEQLIRDSFSRHGLRAELEIVLERSLILFDGVNELPSEEARSQLSAFRRNHPKLPMIFTTRDLSLGGDLGIEQKLEMQPLTEAQMQAFIRAYLPEQADQMLRQLRDRLREFGQTPLLLWMLCGVFHQTPDSTLPRNLGEFFKVFTEAYEQSSVCTHEVAALKGDVKPLSDRRLWKKALKALALLMMQGKTPVDFRVVIHRHEAEEELSRIFPNEQFPIRDILDDLLKYHLLQNRSTDQIEFRHQLIQEYYAAEALLEQLPKLDDERLKREFLNFLKWTESAALMLALVDRMQAKRMIKLVLDVDLGLAKRLAEKVQSSFQGEVIELVNERVPSWLEPTILPRPTSPTAFTLFPPDFELFVVETSPQEVLNLIEDPNFSYEDIYDDIYSAVSGLSSIDSDAIIPSLLKLLESFNSDVRWGAAVALGQIGSDIAIPSLLKLLKDSDSGVRLGAIQALGEICSDAAIPELCKLIVMDESSVRREVAVALGKIRSDTAIGALLQLSTDLEISVREQAAYSLGHIGSATAILGLMQLLKDADSDTSSIAADSIRRIANKSKNKSEIAQHLPKLLTLIPTDAGEAAHYVIRAIQENCEYYNYEIYQAYLEAQKADRQTHQNSDRSNITYDLRGATIGNLAREVQGNQIAHMQTSAKSNVSPSPKTDSLTLFYSYAHADETLRDELDKHLKLLQRQGIITAWHDRDITAGTDWASAIDQNLNTADIILLLISANFLASDYCYETELTRALDRHTKGEARIIPIILKPCDWESAPFGKLQALLIAHTAGAKAVTTWNNQDEAFLAIAKGIRKVAEAFRDKKETADRQTHQNNDRSPTINHFPNATEVKIFENVDRYYEAPPSSKDPPS